MIAFTVHGEPAPQGSKTVGRTKGGGSYVREDNPQTKPWRSAVAAAASEAMDGRPPLVGPVRLDVVFVFGRPRSHYGTGRNAERLKASAPHFRSTKPDVDKLARAVADAIGGIVLLNDAQVVQLLASKHYGAPAAHVTVSELPA